MMALLATAAAVATMVAPPAQSAQSLGAGTPARSLSGLSGLSGMGGMDGMDGSSPAPTTGTGAGKARSAPAPATASMPTVGGPNVHIPTTGDQRTDDGFRFGDWPAGAQTSSITTGPFLVMGESKGSPGTVPLTAQFGGNAPSIGIGKPCTDCYVLDMKANLVMDGKQVDLPDKVMLHHIVIGRKGGDLYDPTCDQSIGGASLGQRFFASGNELTDIRMPAGYGIAVGSDEKWSSFTHLMNWNPDPRQISVTMTYTWIPKSKAPGMKPVLPIWLDAGACNPFDTFELPQTGHVQAQKATWTSPINGKIIGNGGHLHSNGIVLSTVNRTQGRTVCNSWGRHFSSPRWTDGMGMPGVSSMTRCYQKDPAHPLGVVHRGDQLETTAYYDTMNDSKDPKLYLMGIMVTFLDQS